MNYEEKYKQALGRAKDMLSYKEVRKEDMEYLFPELKESEDERIRKDIVAYIKRQGQHIDKYKWHQWLAWLEKQGNPSEDESTWLKTFNELLPLYDYQG